MRCEPREPSGDTAASRCRRRSALYGSRAQRVVRPELLGLPEIPAASAGKELSGRALERTLYDALRSGDSAAAKGCVAGYVFKRGECGLHL